MIEIVDLYKYYGDRRAVGPLSFTIQSGEVVGLLGLNGAGKTTTLRVLACDLLPSRGTVRVDGLDVVDNPDEVRAQIGYLPDVPPLYNEMTVQHYLYFAARLRGVSPSDIDKSVADVLELTQLNKVANDPISSLSHGYRQRVGIAQAVVHKPKLLVLDEPISGLDPVQIVEMRELLRSLKGKHTILISSHILSEISETCDRLLVIRDGRVEASGTEQELSARLLHSVRAEITFRHAAGYTAHENGNAGEAHMVSLLHALPGVLGIESLPPQERGEAISTLRIEASQDIREAACHTIVSAGGGILSVRASERELESVFLRLSGAERVRSSSQAPKSERGTIDSKEELA